MLAKDIIRTILYGIGLSSLAALVWFAGPYVAFGDYRPLENYVVRQIVILLLVAGVASLGGFKLFQRIKSGQLLAKAVSGEDAKDADDSVVLKDKMKDALATLKSASGGKKHYLYDLPWYVLIGPPGSGKTTALINSGLKFPLSRGATPAAIAGVGGTRYCDWWFTEDAVLIDTAGRYTTQDSDAKADKQSWLSFLDLLKKNRPRQPINGVLVVISLEDILTLSSADLAAHANAVRARLLELHDRLKVDFPVYALFTKGDLVAGFVEFFGFLNDAGRRQVWGATFQTADKTRNMINEVPVEFDLLLERLSEETLDRLQDEPAPDTRVLLFGFPTQMARLKQPIHDFLNQIFEPSRYHANATLRGFYFTSGTQQGSPIDQLIGSLVKTFGAEQVAAASYSGLGKSFFLHDLIRKVIIGEAAWVSTDRAAVRRAFIIKAAAYAVIGTLAIGLTTAWLVSYNRNRGLIDQTEVSDKEYVAMAGPYAQETLIADRDLHKIIPLLHKLRYMPAGHAQRDTATPVAATFGLSQRERLQSAAETAYHVGLEKLFRPRLVFRLEEQLDANLRNPGFIYEALKVYMMLGGLHPVDRKLVLSWMQRDWADNLYPGAGNVAGRKALEEHFTAMLDLEEGQPLLIELDGRLLSESQKTLARLSVAQRAYELLKSQSRGASGGEWTAARKGGPDVEAVFEAAGGQPLDTIRVPEFFTYTGFHQSFIARLGDLAEQMRGERWVLGDLGQQAAVATQYDSLADDLLDLYSREFVQVWRDALGKLRMKKMTADKPKYLALVAISSPTSPLKQIMESIRDETALTRERPNAAGGTQAKSDPAQARPLPTLLKSQDRAPGATIETAFKTYHQAVEGETGRRPLDEVISNLREISYNLVLSATNPAQRAQANTTLQNQVASLRTNAARLPPPFSDMMRQAVGEFEGNVAESTAGQILVALRDQVIPACQQTITNRYPFMRGSEREVPLADFARLFSPNGILDGFFKQHLASYADTSKPQWTWRNDSAVARTFTPGAIRDFQRAAEIRDAYFQSGGNLPMVSLAVKPSAIAGPNATAKFEVGGTSVSSPVTTPPAPPPAFGAPAAPPPPPPPPQSGSPVAVQWPGPSPRTAIVVQTDTNVPPSVLERSGPWSLFRMLEAGSLQLRGETASATFIVGGRELQYQITSASSRNPLNLSALREFRCPTGI
ncbi:MAG: type VI secretion system membrane subunit TssM [Xanthobacteraceae bacterium]